MKNKRGRDFPSAFAFPCLFSFTSNTNRAILKGNQSIPLGVLMKRFSALFCALLLLLSAGCRPAAVTEEADVRILASTYPVYLLTCAVTQGLDGVQVERLNTGSVSCLHDYTLSVTDMRKIDRADVLVLSGAGLEDFMDDALASSPAPIIDCSTNVSLLVSPDHRHEQEHHDHDHGHFDPHYWLDPANASAMVDTLLDGLLPVLGEQAQQMNTNAETARALFAGCEAQLQTVRTQNETLPGLISFHDGFGYLAHACGVTVLRAIEEEAGSEASARDIMEVSALVREHNIPLIFTERSGSDATAKAIALETGCDIRVLSTLMDGPNADELSCSPAEYYANELLTNASVLVGGLTGREVVFPI